MSAAVLDRPSAARRRSATAELSLFDAVGGEPTLDEVMSSAWEGLAARRPVGCPMCGGELVRVSGAGVSGVIGRCEDCGTSMS